MKNARILFASLIGTTIEFFDFYIYATAAVLVFPKLFFPHGNPGVATLQSLATFALAFFARPVGSALFGHFGDLVGRKTTLVAALMTMGLSTVAIGFLPSYASIGIWATVLLCLCRFGQGVGLGGEWGGAVLLAIENAPPGKRAWFGMFPQMGAPLGFMASSSVFLILSRSLSETDFLSWGWRIPFIASSVLVIVGLWVRLSLEETAAFRQALEQKERVKVPIGRVIRRHPGSLVFGALAAVATFVTFYLMTVFTLSWGTTHLGFTRTQFLLLQLVAVVFLAITIPLSALLADRIGRKWSLVISSLMVMGFGLTFSSLFQGGSLQVLAFLSLGLAVMGMTYGPLGTALAETYPTLVRYTGTSLSFNLAGILGASLTPAIASYLAQKHGVGYVGYYLSFAGFVTLVATWLLYRKKKASEDLSF